MTKLPPKKAYKKTSKLKFIVLTLKPIILHTVKNHTTYIHKLYVYNIYFHISKQQKLPKEEQALFFINLDEIDSFLMKGQDLFRSEDADG